MAELEPVYGRNGNVAFWFDRNDEDDPMGAFSRRHIMRRYYDWEYIPSGGRGRASALFLDLPSYTATLDKWNSMSKEWRYASLLT